MGPKLLPQSAPTTMPQLPSAQVLVSFLDANHFAWINPAEINKGQSIELSSEGPHRVEAPLSVAAVNQVLGAERFHIVVSSATPTFNLGFDAHPVFLGIKNAAGQTIREIRPLKNASPKFYGGRGLNGSDQQIVGRDDGNGPLADFSF